MLQAYALNCLVVKRVNLRFSSKKSSFFRSRLIRVSYSKSRSVCVCVCVCVCVRVCVCMYGAGRYTKGQSVAFEVCIETTTGKK